MNYNYKDKNPVCEPVKGYEPFSCERTELKNKLYDLSRDTIEIPLIIGGKEIKTGNFGTCVMPHDHKHVLAKYHKATPEHIQMAIDEAMQARDVWSKMPWEQRAAIFKKAAVLLQGKYRSLINASTMLGQSKTVQQAEIDAACEMIDFLNFNVKYMEQIYDIQPNSTATEWNRVEYRGLEGFVLAISPFNFTSIAGNLAAAPAMMGNVVVWKPSGPAVFSNYFMMKLLMEAGVPDGVINFVPSDGSVVGSVALNDRNLAGIHFTGSTAVFNTLWKNVGENIGKYAGYPRLVGETGGKDFVFADETADIPALSTALLRGAFEFQGQKCSAASRAYIPRSVWKDLKPYLLEEVKSIKMGQIDDFENFIGAVIDEKAFDKIMSYVDFAHESDDADVIAGGKGDKSVGFFIEPTIIEAKTADFRTMTEEIFGPVLTVFVYEPNDFVNTLDLCDNSTEYALTGAIFSQDRENIVYMTEKLVHAAGNFYVNDKPTGAVVGQQPFGGSRASGTNDKAGSMLNLLRWVSPRTVKENLSPPTEYGYKNMCESHCHETSSKSKNEYDLDNIQL